MERIYLNIPTKVALEAAKDDIKMSALALSVCIKALKVHSVFACKGSLEVGLRKAIHCSQRKARRYIEIAEMFPTLFEVGEGYIKAHSIIKRCLEKSWSRKTKRHGRLELLGVDRLRFAIPEVGALSINAVKKAIRELLALDTLRRAYVASRHVNKSASQCQGFSRGLSKKLYSDGFVGNVTVERIGRIIGQSSSSASLLVDRLINKGLIAKEKKKFDYQGRAEDFIGESGIVIIGGKAFDMIPNAYRFASRKAKELTGHLIYNHSRRTHIAQVEKTIEHDKVVLRKHALDAANPSVKLNEIYAFYGVVENDML